MDEIIGKMVASAPGIVGVIVVVVIFLKFMKVSMEQFKDQSAACHARTKEDREAYQKQIEAVVDRQEKMASNYEQGMLKFSENIGKNGEILVRMEKALWHQHRRENDPMEVKTK